MSNDKERFTQEVHEVLEKMDKDEKFANNQALKKVIQETHDKKYKEAEVLRNERYFIKR